MRFILSIFIILLTGLLPEPSQAGSGLPVPRFVSLKSDTVNVRSGPGTRYPIVWVYKRHGYPVKIIDEFETWRHVEDADGYKGWVFGPLLSGQRTAVISGGLQTLRARPELDAPPVLRAEQDVLGTLEECVAEWCEIEIDGVEGWLPKSGFWGALEEEIFD